VREKLPGADVTLIKINNNDYGKVIKMRCPKCATISFDYMDTCENCRASLASLKEQLGPFMKPSRKLNWFEIAEGTFNHDVLPSTTAGSQATEALDVLEPITESRTTTQNKNGNSGIDMDFSSLEKDESMRSNLDNVLDDVLNLKKTE